MWDTPYIQELDKDLYVVRTDPESMWYKGSDFYEALEFCALIKDFQTKWTIAMEAIVKAEQAMVRS
jgi:hypothetical protein